MLHYVCHNISISAQANKSSTFGTSVYTPAAVPISEQFNVSITAALVPLTVYVLGLALGPAISAPISETFGRKIVYLTLFPISCLFTLGAGLSNSFASLTICRFLAGTIGSAGLAVGAGSMSDMFIPLDRAPSSSVRNTMSGNNDLHTDLVIDLPLVPFRWARTW